MLFVALMTCALGLVTMAFVGLALPWLLIVATPFILLAVVPALILYAVIKFVFGAPPDQPYDFCLIELPPLLEFELPPLLVGGFGMEVRQPLALPRPPRRRPNPLLPVVLNPDRA